MGRAGRERALVGGLAPVGGEEGVGLGLVHAGVRGGPGEVEERRGEGGVLEVDEPEARAVVEDVGREQVVVAEDDFDRLRRETEQLRRRAAGRTNSVARTFDRICELLNRLGYLDEGGRTVTADGQRLARLYTERDLLTAQCLRHGVWNRLDAAGLARPCGPAEGPYAEFPLAALVLHINRETIHHGAEISLLRDLYRARR